MRKLSSNPNVINSDPNYPDGRIKDNTGSGDGTGVNERVYGDIHSNISKLMRLYGIEANNFPDNETTGYQIIEALRALSTKNTIVAGISSSGGVLQASMKLGYLLTGEKMYCKASVNYSSETQIKGTDAVTLYNVTVVGNFVSGDYIELVRTTSGVELRRVIDQSNINSVVVALNFLKKATQDEENAGEIDTVATTPLTNLVAFILRVNGDDSDDYLATVSQNGIYPKEHFTIVEGIGANPVRNVGTASGIDINAGSIGTTYAVTGDIVSATLTSKPTNASVIRVVVSNTMTDTNYYVRMYIQSLSTLIGDDNAIGVPVFKVINATTFDISIEEFQSQGQNLRIHFEVVKI